MFINSKDNDKIKYTKSLLKTKTRNKDKKFIVEGYRILTLAIECSALIDYVFINEDFENKEEHKTLIKDLEKLKVAVYKTTNKLFEEFCDTKNTQGVIGVVKFNPKNENELSKDDRFVLVLDRIQDPGNMGTIIRTADACGIDSIVLIKGCVDIYNPKVIRSTMGSIFDMNIVSLDEEDAIKMIKKNDFKIVSSYLDTENFYNDIEYDYKSALVIGNEANGISQNIIDNSDTLVKIPIYGKAESLNAGISAAILMYEIKKYI
ncbi:MAG: RNA methyltransferase [Peptostreptococcaceae bacterium]